MEEKGKTTESQLERLNENVEATHAELNAIKSSEVFIPQGLQAIENGIADLKNEDIKLEGAIKQLQTRIDTPRTVVDLVNDLDNFPRAQDKVQYITENLDLLNTLSQFEKNRILDMLIDSGAFNVF